MRIFKPNKVGKPKPYIIIEMAQSHDGSIGMLHSMIDEISKLGVDAIIVIKVDLIIGKELSFLQKSGFK